VGRPGGRLRAQVRPADGERRRALLDAAGFDAVTGNFVIHAMGDPAAVLAELQQYA
jgi:hypothetical protein